MRHDKKKHAIAATGPWLPLPLDFLRSLACAEISPHGSKLLLDVLAQLGPNAIKNGDLSITPKLMRTRGWSSRSTLYAAMAELVDNKLLIQTRQGSRLCCSLFAVTFYPLDCDLGKLDIRPGAYLSSDYMRGGDFGKPPTEARPARWRAARKTQTLSPQRDNNDVYRPATGQLDTPAKGKTAISPRHGTKQHLFSGIAVPSRVTSLNSPSVADSDTSSNVVKMGRQRRPLKSPLRLEA